MAKELEKNYNPADIEQRTDCKEVFSCGGRS